MSTHQNSDGNHYAGPGKQKKRKVKSMHLFVHPHFTPFPPFKYAGQSSPTIRVTHTYSLRGSSATLRRPPCPAQSQHHHCRRRPWRCCRDTYARTRRTPHHPPRVGPRSQRRRCRHPNLSQCDTTPTPLGACTGAHGGRRRANGGRFSSIRYGFPRRVHALGYTRG
jgi:hypothetical protein